MKIEYSEFPKDGYDLSPREYKILTDLVGERYFKYYDIKVEDHYYYCYYADKYDINLKYYNKFDFIELKDYLLSRYYIHENKPLEYLELLKKSKTDPSFDDNWVIKWVCLYGTTEVVRFLLNDHRVDPTTGDNYPIKIAHDLGRKEMTKILLNDERVRSKLSLEEINKYTNEIS